MKYDNLKFGLHVKGAKEKLYKYIATVQDGITVPEVVKYTSSRFRILRYRHPVTTRQEEQ